MDTSDFYDTAVLALDAIEKSSPLVSKGGDFEASIQIRKDAVEALVSFIRAADEERAQNDTRAAHRCNNAENNRKDA